MAATVVGGFEVDGEGKVAITRLSIYFSSGLEQCRRNE